MPADAEATLIERRVPPHEAEAPVVFSGRWRVVSLLGAGGMGSVYLAYDSELDEMVALKVVDPSFDLRPDMLARFREEVRLARRVSSPHVARTHDLGEQDGRLFLTMQYVEGQSLAARLKRGPLAVHELARMAGDVCAGLEAIHAAGVVHRDLKPGNVLLAPDGHAVITDFGIALRASSAHTDGYGTPSYAAPEQLAGEAVGARADVFALGALLFTAATAQRPFSTKRTGGEPPPDPRAVDPSIPEALGAIVVRAMALDPTARFASASEVRTALAVLAQYESRAESELFALVHELCRPARSIVLDLAYHGASPLLRDAVASHLAARLGESGEVRVGTDREAAVAVLEGDVTLREGACTLAVSLHSRGGDTFWRTELRGPAAELTHLAESAASLAARALATETRPPTAAAAFGSEEAATLFLQARAEYRQLYPDHLARALQMFTRLEELGCSSALGWKALALARQGFWKRTAEDPRALCEQALATGGDDPEPHVALGWACLQEMSAVEGASHFVDALRLAPGTVDARDALAHVLLEAGAIEPALGLARSVTTLDASYITGAEVEMRVAALRGRYADALDVARRADRQQAGWTRLQVHASRVAVWNRDRAALHEFIDRIDTRKLDRLGFPLLRTVSHTVLESGRPPASFEPFVAGASLRRRAFVFQLAAELSAWAHEDDRALRALDEAVAAGLFDASWMDACPLFDPYRGSVHFETARRAVHARAFDVLVALEEKAAAVRATR